MRTALDRVPAELDQHEQGFVEKIRKFGWVGTYVAADAEGPGFGYTTGFWLKFEFPEVITFSLPEQAAHDTFWHMYRELEAGKRFAIGKPEDSIFENASAMLLPVSPNQYQAHLGWGLWFYGGSPFLCLQLAYPDSNGRFPWSEEVSDGFRAVQPDLTDGNWMGFR